MVQDQKELLEAMPYGIAHGIDDLDRAISTKNKFLPWLKEVEKMI